MAGKRLTIAVRDRDDVRYGYAAQNWFEIKPQSVVELKIDDETFEMDKTSILQVLNDNKHVLARGIDKKTEMLWAPQTAIGIGLMSFVLGVIVVYIVSCLIVPYPTTMNPSIMGAITGGVIRLCSDIYGAMVGLAPIGLGLCIACVLVGSFCLGVWLGLKLIETMLTTVLSFVANLLLLVVNPRRYIDNRIHSRI